MAKKGLEIFVLNVTSPAIVNNYVANMKKAFNNTLRWDWLCCGFCLIDNIITAGFTGLENNEDNPD